jgi:hypothetical protein
MVCKRIAISKAAPSKVNYRRGGMRARQQPRNHHEQHGIDKAPYSPRGFEGSSRSSSKAQTNEMPKVVNPIPSMFCRRHALKKTLPVKDCRTVPISGSTSTSNTENGIRT